MSLMGVKRTWAIALHMSAFDPKRTWALMLCYAAVGLRIPSALIARSFTNIGSRSPVAVTLFSYRVIAICQAKIDQSVFIRCGHNFNFVGPE
jgi:hypothetical protein